MHFEMKINHVYHAYHIIGSNRIFDALHKAIKRPYNKETLRLICVAIFVSNILAIILIVTEKYSQKNSPMKFSFRDEHILYVTYSMKIKYLIGLDDGFAM